MSSLEKVKLDGRLINLKRIKNCKKYETINDPLKECPQLKETIDGDSGCSEILDSIASQRFIGDKCRYIDALISCIKARETSNSTCSDALIVQGLDGYFEDQDFTPKMCECNNNTTLSTFLLSNKTFLIILMKQMSFLLDQGWPTVSPRAALGPTIFFYNFRSSKIHSI